MVDTTNKIDLGLFERISRHVKAGRLHVVNGWSVQLDTNLPSPPAFVMRSG
jgi:hypothetical protein